VGRQADVQVPAVVRGVGTGPQLPRAVVRAGADGAERDGEPAGSVGRGEHGRVAGVPVGVPGAPQDEVVLPQDLAVVPAVEQDVQRLLVGEQFDRVPRTGGQVAAHHQR
jgi:hypothetical protein